MTEHCSYTFDPDEYQHTTIESTWSCPHDTLGETEYCPFHQHKRENEEETVLSDEEITDLFLKHATGDVVKKRQFIGAKLPELDLNYKNIKSDNQHTVDLRHAEIAGIDAERAQFGEELDLSHAEIGHIDFENTDFNDGLTAIGCIITGTLVCYETVISGETVNFTDATFEGEVVFEKCNFEDDVRFSNTTFKSPVDFTGTSFYGDTATIGHITEFNNAVFEDTVSLEHTVLEDSEFKNIEFNGELSADGMETNGVIEFTKTIFNCCVSFNEVEFNEDTSFKNTTFKEQTTFKETTFKDGGALTEEAVTFDNATFEDEITFTDSTFDECTFTRVTAKDEFSCEDATFNEDAVFEHATFHRKVNFTHAVFNEKAVFKNIVCESIALFDEIIFDGDADFTYAEFKNTAQFRGSEFRGGTNYYEEDAIFNNVTFHGEANFTDTYFNTAKFTETTISDRIDFTDAVFNDELIMKLLVGEETTAECSFCDMTNAVLTEGEIVQPKGYWIWYDFTDTTIGDIKLKARTKKETRELLDYFRFCNTEFNGFDFAKHTEYLDRNDWNLHHFTRPTSIPEKHEYKYEMTPKTIENTYLNAKQTASNKSQLKAAGEFRIKRQQAAQDKFINITKDATEDMKTRLQNGLRAMENIFLEKTCGYGLRLYRIAAVFIIFPAIAAFLFAFGGGFFETGAGQIALGELTTTDGLYTLAINIYFSYITFLTIGYGNIAPIGLGARFIAAILVYLNVILGGLFLYALIKRSEV